jgi:phosphopantetheine adenylyltransferase
MRQIDDLLTIYNSKGRDYIHGLLKKFTVIKEKSSDTSLHAQIVEGELKYFKGTSNKEISIIDRSLQSIYENPIDRTFNQILSLHGIGLIPENYRFAFRYSPTNNKILLEEIRVIESSSKIRFIEDDVVLEKWSNDLNLDGISVIYFGRLKKHQIDAILESLDNGKDDIYDILKANQNISESLTMKFLDRLQETVSTKILNPTIKVTKAKGKNASDTYSIALQDVLAFMNTVNFDTFKPKGEDKSHRILNLISSLYAKYMTKNSSKYDGMEDLDGPDFAKDIPDFGINLKNVTDKKAIEWLKESQINKEIFKLFLGTFTKKRKKTSILIDNNTKFEINKIIDMISDRSIDKPKSKESIPTFEDYYYGKYQKRALLESNLYEGKLNLIHEEPGKQSVNILVGRFQPPTLGHIKVLRRLHAKNSLPVVVIQVRSKTGKKTPFENETILKIWMDIAKQYKFIDAIREAPTGFLDQILNVLRPEYEPVLWGTGSDRLADYNRMIKLYGKEANVLPEFQTSEIKRDSKNISATEVREALLTGNEKEFKKLTPKAEHKFYEQLVNELKHSL